MDILIGGDPEFFVTKDGELVSAHGLIEGTKKNPIPMGGGHAQVDGMALEINIPPSKTAEEFWDGFNNVMDALKRELPKYEFVFQPVAQFGRELIDKQPIEARQLGCEPDFSAHTGKANVPPNADVPFRTASGHIHVGWTEDQDVNDPDHMEACRMLSKQLDTAIGLPSLLWDDDTVRRTLYGKAGCFRPKHYGMEYRTLSNLWLTDKEIVRFVFDNTVQAFNDLVEQKNYQSSAATVKYLEKGDWENAAMFYTRVGSLKWPPLLDKAYRHKILEKQKVDREKLDKLEAKERNKLLKKGGHVVDKEMFQINANDLAMKAWRDRMAQMMPPAPPPLPAGIGNIRRADAFDVNWAGFVMPNPAAEMILEPRPWAVPAPQIAILDDVDDNDEFFDLQVHEEDEEEDF